jgi:hypothetical protein
LSINKDFPSFDIQNNLLPKFPASSRDMLAAEDIFGVVIGSLKGKTTRRIPEQAILYQ